MTVQFRDLRIREIAPASKASVMNDLKDMDGVWKAVSMVADGKEASRDFLNALVLTVKDGGFTVKTAEEDLAGTFKLNVKATPKTMDVEMKSGEERELFAVYEIEGDNMKVCYSPVTRPTEFSSAEDSKRILATYKRVSH
jgi:uncharacterized protein (TIGR03067 family)